MSTPYTETSQQTRAKVIAAARSLYLEEGVEALSMRRIASLAGLGTMTAYRHFANKEALLAEIAGAGFELFSTYFYRALEGPTPAARLWLCGEQFLAFALEHPRYYEAMFTFPIPELEAVAETSASRRMSAAHQFLEDRVREVVAAPEEAGPVALSLFALCHGMVALQLARRYDAQLDFPSLFRRTLRRALVGQGLVPADFDPIEVP